MHHDVKETAATKNKLRSGWTRLFVRAETDAAGARLASQLVPCRLSECSLVDVEADSAGPRQCLSLYGATAP